MKPDKIRQLTLAALDELISAAARCSFKFGHDDAGAPRDWQEWTDLRRAITQARHALAREGA